MIIKNECQLANFAFWGGAVDTVSDLDYSDMCAVESILEDMYPNGISEGELNDIFWFERDFVAQCLGYDDYESFIDERFSEYESLDD